VRGHRAAAPHQPDDFADPAGAPARGRPAAAADQGSRHPAEPAARAHRRALPARPALDDPVPAARHRRDEPQRLDPGELPAVRERVLPGAHRPGIRGHDGAASRSTGIFGGRELDWERPAAPSRRDPDEPSPGSVRVHEEPLGADGGARVARADARRRRGRPPDRRAQVGRELAQHEPRRAAHDDPGPGDAARDARRDAGGGRRRLDRRGRPGGRRPQARRGVAEDDPASAARRLGGAGTRQGARKEMSPAFRHAHAAARRWQDAARACAEGVMPAPRGANLGFLYFSDHYAAHAAEILDYMKEETGVDDWIGTVGMGVIATGTEYLDEPAMSVMLGAFPPDSYRVFSGRRRPPRAGTRTASGSLAANFA